MDLKKIKSKSFLRKFLYIKYWDYFNSSDKHRIAQRIRIIKTNIAREEYIQAILFCFLVRLGET
ncbi:MAG: hypothetical protein ACOYJ8_03715 [Patescibacteria group bacterium]|jgi:hypothetical protein